MFRKNAKIHFKSVITDLTLPDTQKFAELLYESLPPDKRIRQAIDIALEKTEKEKYEFYTDAELSGDGEQISLVYEENSEMGMGQCITMLNFNESDPCLIRLVRSGQVTGSMLFNNKNRFNRCTYNVSNMSFELGIYTRNINNTLTEKGGVISIDFIIEIEGKKAERNQIFISVKTE